MNCLIRGGEGGYFERNVCALNPGKVDDPAWNRPLQSLYSTADRKRALPSHKKREVRKRMKAKMRMKELVERAR